MPAHLQIMLQGFLDLACMHYRTLQLFLNDLTMLASTASVLLLSAYTVHMSTCTGLQHWK